MTMITPSYLGETIEYSSLHACRSTLEDPTRKQPRNTLGILAVSGAHVWLDHSAPVGQRIQRIEIRDKPHERRWGLQRRSVGLRDGGA